MLLILLKMNMQLTYQIFQMSIKNCACGFSHGE